jgi:hypothetical protein
MTEESEFDSWQARESVHFPPAFRMALVDLMQSPVKWILWAFCMAVKWPGRKADQSPTLKSWATNMEGSTTTPPYIFIIWSLINPMCVCVCECQVGPMMGIVDDIWVVLYVTCKFSIFSVTHRCQGGNLSVPFN